MLPAVPSTSPAASIALAAPSTASFVVVGCSPTLEHLRVLAVVGYLAGDESGETVGDDLRVVRLGVVGRSSDVRGQHDVRHRRQRMVDGERLTLEVVESGRRDVPGLEGGGQGVE